MFRNLYFSLSLRRDNSELLRAQMDAFSRHIPLLYFTLLVNFFAVAATHVSVAPAHLTIGAPLVLAVICISRVVFWWRSASEKLDDATAFRRLRAVSRLVLVLGVCFVAWSFA